MKFTSAAGHIGKMLLVVVAALVAFDVACNVLGLFKPTYNFGEPELGWTQKETEHMQADACPDPDGKRVYYDRNELGIRTSRSVQSLLKDDSSYVIADVGDSHTDLCAPNSETHPGVLESELNRRGMASIVLSYGVGRYSPLQSYILFQRKLLQFRPKALVLNLYTGNDFYDMLRFDDRAHLEPLGDSYRVAPPIWYTYDDPNQPGWQKNSRILFLARSFGRVTGILGAVTRVRYLMATAAAQEPRWTARAQTSLSYLRSVQQAMEPSLGYPAAYAAQMLNQALFFHYFPGSKEESLKRTEFLLESIRSQNPGTLLVLSPIPSYQLVQSGHPDSAWVATVGRMPVTEAELKAQEQELYDSLRILAGKTGWLFVDNLAALRSYDGKERLFNRRDYHITPAASQVIGRNEGETVFAAHLDSSSVASAHAVLAGSTVSQVR